MAAVSINCAHPSSLSNKMPSEVLFGKKRPFVMCIGNREMEIINFMDGSANVFLLDTLLVRKAWKFLDLELE